MTKSKGTALVITLNPCGKYKNKEAEHVWDAMGLLPYFIAECALSSTQGGSETFDAMGQCYGFPMFNMLEDGKGKVSEEGVYSYPQDPDLYPYAQFELGNNTTILVYPYGLVYFKDKDGYEAMARMD